MVQEQDNRFGKSLIPFGPLGPYIHVGSHNLYEGKSAVFSSKDDYALWAIEDGQGFLWVQGRRQTLQSPACVFLEPGGAAKIEIPGGSTWYRLCFDMVHSPRKRGRGHMTFVHDGPATQPSSRTVWEVALPPLVPAALVPACIRMLHRCCGLWWKGDFNWIRANYHLGLFLVEFAEWARRHPGLPQGPEDPGSLERWDAEGLSFGLSVSEMARQAQLSHNQFTRKFKAEHGMLPREYLIELRMDHARHLLQATGLSIRQIALYCGYHSTAAFCHQFLKHNGLTPSAWRRPDHPGHSLP